MGFYAAAAGAFVRSFVAILPVCLLSIIFFIILHCISDCLLSI